MNNNQSIISNKKVACNGAIVAIAAVFGYSLVVAVYVVMRSSSTIYSIVPQEEKTSIIMANGFSVAYSIAIFSLLMALISAILGAVSAVVLKKLLLYFNPEFNVKKAILISFSTALIGVIIIYFMLFALLKDWMTFNYIEPFLFWFLLPAAIFLGVCIAGGSYLNRHLKVYKGN
jgi:hypothetical protein